MGQNAEVMLRPLNLSIVIQSLEVRTIFSLFVLKKHMLGFAQIISVFRTGWRFARVEKVGKSFEAVCDFMARDQFLEACSRELFFSFEAKSVRES